MSEQQGKRKISLLENIRVSLRAIATNKLRAGLTSLGIIIGVATVIAMMSVIGGIDQIVAEEFNRIGANVFTLQKYPAITITFDWGKFRGRKDIEIEDADAILRSCPSIDSVSLLVPYWYGVVVRAEGRKTESDVTVIGTDDAYVPISGMSLDMGRNLTKREVLTGARVCVLGWDIVDKLFPYGSPIGRYVRIHSDRYRIIGVTERLGTMFGQSRDNFVAIPIEAYIRNWQIRDDLQITIQAKSNVPLPQAIDEVRSVMRIRHKLKLTQPDDFEIETRDSLMASYSSLTGSIFLGAIFIAMISLLVGGIGIMNIMLVSVRERTREIGIRKALGARRRDIAGQFLIEAMTLSFLGGLVGIAFSMGGLMSVEHFTDAVPIAYSLFSVVLAFSFSVTVGVIFGAFPAIKASGLDPIESLRYE